MALALNLSRIDLSHQYDPDSPVKLQYRVVQVRGEITVHLFIQTDTTLAWNSEYLIQTGYEMEEHRKFFPQISELQVNNGLWRGSISFTPQGSEDLIIIKYSADFNFYFDIPLKNGYLSHASFYPINDVNPVTGPFLASQNLAWSNNGEIEVTEYPNKFGPADAPMEEMKPLAPTLFEDTVFYASDSVGLKDYKLYFFRMDTVADIGVPLFKTPPYFPSLRKIHELIPPMKYITTEAEYRTLKRSNKPKRTFDEFWINTYGTKFRARNAIRKYFKSVEYANQYFTNIKEGWKTDRGLLLIIYGTPMELYRTDLGETWVYEDEEFEFIKVSTLFGPIYALKKDKKYEKDWYKTVGDIRRGE